MSVSKVKFTTDDNIVLAQHPIDTTSTKIKTATAERVVEIDSGEGCIERYIAKMKQFRNYPPAQFTYHAFGNRLDHWTPEKAKIMVDFARSHGLELRAWANDESGINLLVLKDPDSSEDSGMEIYELMQDQFDSYGLASWYEYEQWGVPVYTGEDVVIDWLKDKWGIKIGDAKENEWVSLS